MIMNRGPVAGAEKGNHKGCLYNLAVAMKRPPIPRATKGMTLFPADYIAYALTA